MKIVYEPAGRAREYAELAVNLFIGCPHTTHDFVDHYKVGKLNYHKLASEINRFEFLHGVVGVFDDYGCSYYVKNDLWGYDTTLEQTR